MSPELTTADVANAAKAREHETKRSAEMPRASVGARSPGFSAILLRYVVRAIVTAIIS